MNFELRLTLAGKKEAFRDHDDLFLSHIHEHGLVCVHAVMRLMS